MRTIEIRMEDSDYIFYQNGEEVGECSMNLTDRAYIDWIEVYEPYRKKGMIRKMLKLLFKTLNVEELYFYCKASLVPMYHHLGATKLLERDHNGSSDMVLTIKKFK